MPHQNDEIRDALNRHGVFLKKAILERIPRDGLEIHEEIGSSFGGTRVADIVAIQKFPDQRKLYLVLECKRVADDRRWIFFRHMDRQVRVARKVVSGNRQSLFKTELDTSCSEGFEFPLRDKKESPVADNDPVFKAASQLSAAYLGIAQERWLNRSREGVPEYFVPILVTTAQLSIVLNRFDAAPVTTGRIEEDLRLKDVPELVLKHPFPTPAGFDDDFRRKTGDPWHQRFTESINIVRADHLPDFLHGDRREIFVDL